MKLGDIRKELAQASKTYKPIARAWTDEEKAIVNEFYNKVPIRLLAEKLGRTIASIQQYGCKSRTK